MRDDRALVDFETQASGSKPCFQQNPPYVADEAGIRQVFDRGVHADRQRPLRGYDFMPERHLTARFVQYPPAERYYETRVFGGSQEIFRAKQPMLRMVPAHERFESD